MTEKRFMLDDAGELIDKETAQFIEYGEKVCELLNALHEENQELRLLIDTLKEQNMKFKLRLKDLGVEYL